MLRIVVVLQIYLLARCLAQMYSVRHHSYYFICNYFVVKGYIDLEPV